MIHARLTYRTNLMIGTLLALSACGAGDAKQSDVDALRQEVAVLKQSQAAMQATIASLQSTDRTRVPVAPTTQAPTTPDRDAVHRIPTSYAPRKGNAISAVTVVEFADFQCPYCQAAAGLPDQLIKEFPNDVQFAFKHYPLGRHAQAFEAAKASWAAQQQDKFWEMHNLIFGGDVSQLSPDVLRDYAQQLGLDMARYEADKSSPKAATMIGIDKQLGRIIKIGGTPAYFVNGRRVPDPTPAKIRAMVAEEIAKIKQGAQAGLSPDAKIAESPAVPGASANGS